MKDSIHILFVEDFADDAILIVRRLSQLGMTIEHDIVDTADDLIAALKAKSYDVVLCDYHVPGLGADRSLALIGERAPHVPAIVVSGSIGEEQAADLMRAGARDIVIKSNLARLAPAIEREVAAREQQARLIARADESERHFTNLVERSIQGIAIRSLSKTLFANETMAHMFGYSLDEVYAMTTAADIIHPDDRERVASCMARQFRGEETSQNFETIGLRKDGTTFWARALVSSIAWFGQPAIQIVAVDITERKRAEQALADSERQYRQTFEDAPVAMCWIGMDRKFLRTNREFQRLYGYSASELLTMQALQIVHPDHLDAQIAGIAELLKGESSHIVFENRHIRKDRSAIWVVINVATICDDDGNSQYMLVHLQDITERKKAEDQLFHAQKMEAMGNFAGGIAHDFNNMLVPIIGLTDLTKEELPSDSPLQENLDLVLDAATKARDLVRQILTFSRQDETAMSVVNLSAFMHDAMRLLRNMLPATITVIQSIPPDVGFVMANPAQLQSIILNLGSNATAAIGNRIGELRMGLARVQMGDARTPRTAGLVKGAYARLQVGDSGKGMDEATLAKIFDPFFTTKAPGEGTGLGLSMVHGIVERYGGAIDVTSHVGAGTRFDIYLPIVDVANPAERPN